MRHELAVPQPLSVLEGKVHPVGMESLTRLVRQWVVKRERAVVGSLNLHGLYLAKKSPEMRSFYATATCVRADGMGLIGLARLLGLPLERRHHAACHAWLPALLAEASKMRWRVFYLGGSPGVADRAFAKAFGALSLGVATHHGYFDGDADGRGSERVLEQIRDWAPQLLFVGMGMPRQEEWILSNLDRLPACVILTSGGCIDYFAGVQTPPPLWIRSAGLEWAFRLMLNPSRLWFRYLVEPIALMPDVARTLWRARITGESWPS